MTNIFYFLSIIVFVNKLIQPTNNFFKLCLKIYFDLGQNCFFFQTMIYRCIRLKKKKNNKNNSNRLIRPSGPLNTRSRGRIVRRCLPWFFAYCIYFDEFRFCIFIDFENKLIYFTKMSRRNSIIPVALF